MKVFFRLVNSHWVLNRFWIPGAGGLRKARTAFRVRGRI